MVIYRRTLFLLVFPAIFFSTCGCKYLQPKNEFNKFTSKFPNLEKYPRLTYCDTSEGLFSITDTNNILTDSLFSDKYSLLKKYDYSMPLDNFRSVNFRKIGRFKRGDITVLLYSGNTCSAGSGNPVMVISTFNTAGKKIDEMIVMALQEWDFDRQPFDVFNLYPDSMFTVTNVTRNFGFLHKQFVPTYIGQKQSTWSISHNGHIQMQKEFTEILFNESNSAMLIQCLNNYVEITQRMLQSALPFYYKALLIV